MDCSHGPEAVHDWQPLSGWVGRYRCSYCLVIGHRMTTDSEAKAAYGGRPVEQIVPYVCTRRHCKRGAISRKPQACREHA